MVAIKQVQLKSMKEKQGGWNVKTFGRDKSVLLNKMRLIHLPKIGGEQPSLHNTFPRLIGTIFRKPVIEFTQSLIK